jgi:hypothetical protein
VPDKITAPYRMIEYRCRKKENEIHTGALAQASKRKKGKGGESLAIAVRKKQIYQNVTLVGIVSHTIAVALP